jgi:3-hydroxyisobutyrate dehydrogenase-like beta-hydroxyacid dehydrogenase
MPEPVGLIGLGTMGGYMAMNIAAVGVELVVFTRNPEWRAAFEDRGLAIAGTAARSDVVITMVSDGLRSATSLLANAACSRTWRPEAW